MAISITEDLVIGNEVVQSIDGASLVRVFEVQGITGPASSRIQNAIITNGVAPGDPHPTIPELICEEVRGVPWAGISKTGVRIIAKYMDAKAVLVRVNGTLVREPSWVNVLGKLMTVRYGIAAGEISRNAKPAPAQAIIARPHTILEFERILVENPQPDKTHRNYFGHINKGDWQGKKKRQWLCVEHSFQPARGSFARKVYRERFAFEGMPANTGNGPTLTWDTINVYLDRNTGRPPATGVQDVTDAVVEGSGWKREQMYPEADFNKLELPEVL